MLKVKSVLVSQPKPETEKSPYFDLSSDCKVKIDFRPFIHIEGVPKNEFRLQKINLLDFYYPSMFCHNKQTLPIDEIMKYDSTQPSLIVGTVGQGKSIALRYLSFFTLCKSDSIPIFLELRKLRTSTTIFEHIRKSLEKIKLSCSDKLLKHLLNSGAITLFLDGFDEIKHENRTIWIEEIEDLHTKFTQFKIFVTTRPNTDIHHRHLFKTFELSPLSEGDRPNFIRKLVKNTDDQTALITKLSKASNGVIGLLVTPLLMTFFVNIYQGRRKLPNSNSEFFDELFSTILSRHDGLKAAYDRPSKCGFTDKELKIALQALAYQTRKANLRQLPETKLNEIAIMSLNTVALDSSKADEFIYDVNNITCLLQKDGLDYRFVHDSVQEFYSACFVRDQEEAKQDFYNKYINDWHHWSPEFQFLKFIDQVAYKKHMLIPSFSEACIMDGEIIIGIKKPFFIEILKCTDIVFHTDKGIDKTNFICFITKNALNNWVLDLLCKFTLMKVDNEFQKGIYREFSSYLASNINSIKSIELKSAYSSFDLGDKKYYLFNAHKLLSDYKLIERLYESIGVDTLYTLNKEYMQAKVFIEQKRKVGGVF